MFLCKSVVKMSTVEQAKKLAARKAVDEFVKKGSIIGVGSGSTIVYAIERLGEKFHASADFPVTCVPTSFQSRQLLRKHGLHVSDLELHHKLDVCIDGADEVDSSLNLIKGGGGCLLQEKIVASCSERLVIIADYTKNSEVLGQQYKKGIPIEVVPMAYVPVKKKIEELFSGKLELRMAVAKAGPVVTDNGNFILDWVDFDQTVDWKLLNKQIIQIPGVVETGLFIGMASKVFFGMPDGSVVEKSK